MKADLVLDNVKAYDIEKFDIKKGQTCRVVLDTPDPTRWFSDADEVLSVKVMGTEATITANEVGECEIQLQQGEATVKRLQVRVYDQVVSSLGIGFGQPVLK
jgi:tRNA A58 N-methylase Trm61